jgi:hypothetical protein
MVIETDPRLYLQIYYLPMPFGNIFSKKVEESSQSIEMNKQKDKRISALIAEKCSGLNFINHFFETKVTKNNNLRQWFSTFSSTIAKILFFLVNYY